MSRDRQRAEDGERTGLGDPCRRGPASGQRVEAPDRRNGEPDERHVREAVGHRLVARLDDADHRHQRADEPEPADDEIRMAAPCDQG